MLLIYLILSLLLLKLVVNISKYIQTKRYLSKYLKWVAKGGTKLLEDKSQVVSLFQAAGIKDQEIGASELVGYGKIRVGSASIFDNFPNAREDYAQAIVRMFHQAIGVYRSRIFETFNPLYWIEVIINLPKQTLIYLGLSSESVVIKIAQLGWWAVAAVAGFVYALYRPDVEAFVRNLIGRISQP